MYSLYTVFIFLHLLQGSYMTHILIGSDIQPDTTKLLAYLSETKCRWHCLAPVGRFLGEDVHYLITD